MRGLRHVLGGCAVLGIFVLSVGVDAVPASAQSGLPGNLFYQANPPQAPYTTGIAVNNPQNMGGGQWVGGSNYPVGGDSPVLDGSGTNVWSAGVFGGGGMCNVGISSGVYSADTSTFTYTPLGAIDTIRIYAQNYLNSAPNNWWQEFPQQIEIGYSTATATTNNFVNNGYNYNSNTLGQLPGAWNPTASPATAGIATITAVNGAAPVSGTSNNSAYGSGWVNLNGDFTQGATILGPSSTAAYVQLSVVIPAGATSILVSFGQDNSSTGNPGGLAISGIQAALLGSSFTWTGSANNTWSLASSDANWSSSSQAYTDGSLVTFDNTGINPNINVASAVQPFSVTFNNSTNPYTFTGAPISGAGYVVLSSSAGSVTFNSPNTYSGGTTINGGTLILGNSAAVQNSTVTVNATDGLAFSTGLGTASLGGLSGSADFALSDQASNPVALLVGSNGATALYSGAMSGSGSLTKVGAGTQILTGANSYTGGTTVSAGVLQIGNGAVDGTFSGAYAVAGGATLRVDSASGAPPAWGNVSGPGTLELNCGGEVDWGTPALSTTAFTGTLQVDIGRINAIPSNLGGATAVVINNGAQFLAFDGTGDGSPYTYTQNLSLNGMGWGEGMQNYGALRVAGMNATFSGSMTLTGDTGLYTQNFGTYGTSTLTVSGPISDGGQGYNLAINAYGGNITLSGNNTYSGGTTLNTGTLVVGSSSALGTGVLTTNGGIVDLAGNSLTVGGLSGPAGTITSSVASPVTLMVSPASGVTTTFGGTLQDGSGTLSLVMNGAGSLWLTGPNTYSGGTVLAGGTLAVTNGSSLGNISGGLAIGPATLEIAGNIPDGRNISLTDPHATIQVDAPNTFTYAESLTGSGGLTLTGGGMLVLNGSNSYSAGTTVSGGTLQLGNNNALGTGGLTANQGTLDLNGHWPVVPSLSGVAGTITTSVSGLATLTVSRAIGTSSTFSGMLQDGAGQIGLVKSGAGTLVLNGSNAHSGGTTVSQGILQINKPLNGDPLGNGPVNLSGGVLRLVGQTIGVQQTVAASGWNVQGIAANTAASPQAGTNVNLYGWAWYEQGAPNSSQGLPTSGLVTSQYGPANVQFQLQPYSANNLDFVQSGQNFTLALNTPAKFQALQFLQSGQGGGNYSAQLNFSDGSSDTLSSSYLDWTNNATAADPFALTNVGLVGNGGSWGGFYTGQLSLFENDFTLSAADQSKTLDSITLNTSGGGGLMFFALSGNELVPAAPTYTNAVNVTADSTIDVRNAGSGAALGNLSIGGNMLTVTGDSSSVLSVGSAAISGNAAFAPAAGITLNVGALDDGGTPYTITKAGSGTLVLTAAATSFTGTATVNAGLLQLANDSGLGTGSLTVNSGGTFDLHGYGPTIAALNGGGTITNLSSGTSNLSELTVTAGGSYSGTITDGSAPVALALTGGDLVLSGSNTYSGGTFVSGGTLELENSAALAAGSSLTVGDAGAFSGILPAAAPPLAPVPEPATLALLSVALCGAAACRRIRRRSYTSHARERY